ncbi:hypothetical protein L1987_46257 [Smallanthus sonchifolius]|uniref:Uncharacterized protein n=1 Tax=Smallanthus sonchifolius TaxID=185202 RepID=A0ACB9G101_9ASTR|nr:hypothetical protein L1987_46257 [Smallanthus sonchifolius]
MAWVGEVAYLLELPDELSGIHPTFHVSHLRKCLADESAHVPLTDIEVDNSLNYIEELYWLKTQEEGPAHLLSAQASGCLGNEGYGYGMYVMGLYLLGAFVAGQLLYNWGDDVRAYLSSTHEADPAYLPSTQEEDPAYISSTHEEGHAYLSSTHEAGQPGLAYQNKMARRGNGRRGGGRTGGRTGGRNGGRGRTPARQEYIEEGSVHTEPAVGVHGTEQTQVEEQPFTFEQEVRAAIAREFIDLMKVSLPGLLAEALKKVNETGGSNTAVDTPNTEAINAPLNRGCDYKSFKACDPPVLTGKKDAVATFDWVILSHWWEGVRQAKGSEVVDGMMWADLKTLVIKNFCPRNEIEKVEREFLGLKAGSMTHRQYTTRFNELARLMPHLITTEERKFAVTFKGCRTKSAPMLRQTPLQCLVNSLLLRQKGEAFT